MFLALLAAFALGSCEFEGERKLREKWDGAVVVKICRDGTRIYRLQSGELVTGGLVPGTVENAETICR